MFGNSLHQPEYELIKKGFENRLRKDKILYMLKNKKNSKAIENYNSIRNGDITAGLLILDDCYLGKQSKAQSYYTKGRHGNCDWLYISQNYFALPWNSV